MFFCLFSFEFCVIGIVLLDLDEQKIEGIYEAIINDAIANGQMNKDVKDELLRLLSSNHQYMKIEKKQEEMNVFLFF